MIPAAHFVQLSSQCAKCDPRVVWEAIEISAPVANGWAGEFVHQIDLIKQSTEAMDIILSPELSSADKLKSLRKLPGDVGSAAEKVLGDVEYRLISGFDPAESIWKEEPELFLRLFVATLERNTHHPLVSSKSAKAVRELRSQIPGERHALYDEMTRDLTIVMKMRDEIAVYTHLWAAGILHDAVSRCADIADRNGDTSVIASASGAKLKSLMLEGTIEEIQKATEQGYDPQLLDLWKQRKMYRENASIRDAPELIGGVDVDYSLDHFPNEWLARSFSSLMTVIKQMKHHRDFEVKYSGIENFFKDSKKTVFGLPASKGRAEGRACVVKKSEDIVNFAKGDILILGSASVLICQLLPFAHGVVCDFGATTSQVAVCARHFGIPCVIGTKIATSTYQTGQKVRIDGTVGQVEIINVE